MNRPRVTVLMPVFNGEKYLGQAIESILGQTFGDFEFLIVDDGSTDRSLEICRSYADPRIRLERNGANLGLITTLNRGIERAGGEFIARMDGDDISFPERLERQVRFLDENPGVGLCGTWYEKAFPDRTETVKPPAGDREIRFYLGFENVILHPSVMLRKSLLETHGLRYDEACRYAEDYEFWCRCARHTKLAIIPEALVRYRCHPDNTSNRFQAAQKAAADPVRLRQLQALGLEVSPEEADLHAALHRFEYAGGTEGLGRARDWLEKLVRFGARQQGVPERALCRFLSRYWYAACATCADRGWRAGRLFLSSPVGRRAEWTWQWKLLLRCLLRKAIHPTPRGAEP
jgi:glycosyltransferase involved in cell wall biosynthesis